MNSLRSLFAAILAVSFYLFPLYSQDKVEEDVKFVVKKGSDLEIRFAGIPIEDQSRFNGVYQVDNSGNIRMWEIGTIKVAGLTAKQLAQTLEMEMKKIGYSDVISLNYTGGYDDETNIETLNVGGSVHRPGPMRYVKGMTLSQAIISAGGPTEFGTTKRVFITREGKRYELSPLTNEKHKLEKVYPNDIIDVDQVRAFDGKNQQLMERP